MRLKKRHLMVAAVLAVLAANNAALAQPTYRWVDGNGRVQYSDQLPPSSARDQRILKAPLPTGGASASQGMGKVAATKPATLAEQEAGFRRRLAEREKAGRDEELKVATSKARAEGCERARRDLAHLETGARLQRMDAKGELYYMDDAERALEKAHLQRTLARTCQA
jgi:hypothetical protein